MDSLAALTAEITACRACPRLVAWREEVASEKRASYRDEDYWGKPVPGFGDPRARVVVVGLAPAAHGANRTGRMFTGDRSGEWLYGAMHRAGLASQPTSTSRDDGLHLIDAYLTAAVRCAPPANKPTIDERDTCEPYLRRELALLADARVYVALGSVRVRSAVPRLRGPAPSEVRARRRGRRSGWPADGRTILCSFHPSQQNTFTGKLTREMLDAIFTRARELAR